MSRRAAPPLELWGGVECSVVRIGDEYRNQVVDTGHCARFADLDAMAELGIKAVRYPILWETVAPETPTELDFSWHDERLERLRELGIKVIAGLVHHGSGPRYTNLLDPKFPDLLGGLCRPRSRGAIPWIDTWTPVNEPLTTARFSCLYGHWYPHLDRHRRDVPRARSTSAWRSSVAMRGDPGGRSQRRSCWPRKTSARPSRPIRLHIRRITRTSGAG